MPDDPGRGPAARALRRRAGALAAAGIFAIAGQASEGWAAFSYDISLGAGAQQNDNLYLDPRTSGEDGRRQPVQETVLTLEPGVMVSWGRENDRLELQYNGEYSTFQGDEDRDPLWVHNLTAALNWRRWSPFFLEAREARSRVPRPQEGEDQALVDQIDRNQVTVRSGLVWEYGPRGSAELAYRGELESFPGSVDADRVQRHYGEALVRHRWSPLWGGEARAAFGQVERKLTADYSELSVSAAVDQRLSERLAMRYRIEWLRDVEDEAAADGAVQGGVGDSVHSSLLGAAGITGNLARGGSWNLAYEDSLEYLSDGDTLRRGRASAGAMLRARLGSSLEAGGWYEHRHIQGSGREEDAGGPTLGVRWMIAPWAAFDLGGSWTITAINEPGTADVEDKVTQTSAGLVAMMFKRLQFEAGYQYRENDSAGALRSYVNNVVYVAASFHFTPVAPGTLPSPRASW